ncbi:hypothetical protein FNV43_RR20155 [Rhamnella rubrinervis]|uniref:Uncharacterized protein n=1 Tax=Rhamnella rubrinervis TaxID=2594499 RepID=A0A8K0DTW9_9ROSA|nr:hypothetical protein FNV43_RR20155 [Rhamnella rubrinervis]
MNQALYATKEFYSICIADYPLQKKEKGKTGQFGRSPRDLYEDIDNQGASCQIYENRKNIRLDVTGSTEVYVTGSFVKGGSELVGGAFLSTSLQMLFDRLASQEVIDLIKEKKLNDVFLKNLNIMLLSAFPHLQNLEIFYCDMESVSEVMQKIGEQDGGKLEAAVYAGSCCNLRRMLPICSEWESAYFYIEQFDYSDNSEFLLQYVLCLDLVLVKVVFALILVGSEVLRNMLPDNGFFYYYSLISNPQGTPESVYLWQRVNSLLSSHSQPYSLREALSQAQSSMIICDHNLFVLMPSREPSDRCSGGHHSVMFAARILVAFLCKHDFDAQNQKPEDKLYIVLLACPTGVSDDGGIDSDDKPCLDLSCEMIFHLGVVQIKCGIYLVSDITRRGSGTNASIEAWHCITYGREPCCLIVVLKIVYATSSDENDAISTTFHSDSLKFMYTETTIFGESTVQAKDSNLYNYPSSPAAGIWTRTPQSLAELSEPDSTKRTHQARFDLRKLEDERQAGGSARI